MEDFITENINGVELRLKTIPGVFSRNEIDAGSKLLIEKVDIIDGTMIADLGCGAGVIGIYAAKKNPKGHVHLLDVNIRLTNLAQNNIELNGVKNAEVFLSDMFEAVKNRKYDLILSNPPLHLGKEFLEEAISECSKHLKNGSTVTWVVQKHFKPVMNRLFTKYFGNFKVVDSSQKYIIIAGVKLAN